jgi:hypothetical protein
VGRALHPSLEQARAAASGGGAMLGMAPRGAPTVGPHHHNGLHIRAGVRLAQVVEQAVQHCMASVSGMSVSEQSHGDSRPP